MTQNKIKSIFIFPGILLVFTLCKSSELSLPYFWDELGVYARAALYLSDHGPGLLPAALPPELSRGHPLLFSFIYGSAYRLFGDGILTGHILSLSFSILLLVCVFVFVKKYSDANAAIFAVLLISVQPVFYAQSVLVLPEVMLALFILLSIFYWLEKKYFLFVLCTSAAILTKETAIILPLVLMLGNLLNAIIAKQKIKVKPFHFLLFAPWLVFGLFLFIQKQQNGWYLFPLHESNINLNPSRFFQFLGNYCAFVFFEQGRFFLFIPAVLFAIFTINGKLKIKAARPAYFLICLIMGGLLFSSINFYMDRYTLFIICAICMLAGIIISDCLKLHRRFGWILIPMFMGPFIFTGDDFNYDVDMNYKKYIDVQDAAVDYAVEHLTEDDSLFANFPIIYSLRDSRFGYCDTTKINFTIIRKSEIEMADHFLIADPGSFDHAMPAAAVNELKIFQNGTGVIKLMEKGVSP